MMAMPDPGDGPFARAIAVRADGDGRYRGEIHRGWDIGGNANGGYLLALAARAGSDAADGRRPLTVTAHYLAPGSPGAVTFDTTVYRRGTRLSTVGVTMSTDDRLLLRMLGSFHDGHTDEDSGSGAAVERVEVDPPDLPGPDDCVRVNRLNRFPRPSWGRSISGFIPRMPRSQPADPWSGAGFV